MNLLTTPRTLSEILIDKANSGVQESYHEATKLSHRV
jgi:hypothetical protein